MKYKNIEEMKNKAIELSKEGKTNIEISKVLGCSRNYVAKLLEGIERNSSIVKIDKLRKESRVSIPNKLLNTVNQSDHKYARITKNDNNTLTIEFIDK